MAHQPADAESPPRGSLDFAWSPAALLGAWQRLAPRLERHGFDTAELDRLKANALGYCGALAAHVRQGSYRPQPLQPVTLRKPAGGRRMLLVPPVADRLVQAALAQTLSERVDRSFNDASYAYRPGRGVDRAAARVRHEMRQPGAQWILDADIRQCFDSILHEPLIELLRGRGLWRDRCAWLLKAFLRSGVARHGGQGEHCLIRGLPQGSPLSPFLCNLVLDQLDRAFEAAGVPFVRYADDFVAFAADEPAATALRDMATATLAPLGLELQPDKTSLLPLTRGFRFLGVDFHPPALAERERASLLAAPKPETAPVTAPTPALLDQAEPQPPAPAGAEDREVGAEVAAEGDGEDQGGQTHDPLLRTLYLLEHRTALSRDGDTLVVSVPERQAVRLPIHRLHQVLAFGETSLSSGAIALCLQNAVPVMILSGRGRYFGVIDPLRTESVSLQREQFRTFDDEPRCLQLACGFVQGKIANSLCMLRRWVRHRPLPGADDVLDRMRVAQARAGRVSNVAELRGVEGAAAAAYWQALGELLPQKWRFAGRKRQPAPDPVNSMLSYGYTVLYYNVLTLIMARGLNPHLGFMHRPGRGHHALASDLMEEFRAPVVDALVFDMAANRRVELDDFSWPEAADEPCLMSAQARRKLINAFERKMNSTLEHPQFGVVLDYRRVIDGQVLQLVNVLHGQAASYIPFVMRA